MNIDLNAMPKPSDWTNSGGFKRDNKAEDNSEIKPLLVHDFMGDNGATSTGSTNNATTKTNTIDMNTAYTYIAGSAIIGILIGYALCKYKK